jgi:hypothetical protein
MNAKKSSSKQAAPSRRKKSWREKLADDKDLPKIVQMEGRMSRKWGTGSCVIPAPREVDALMQRVPKGKLATIDSLRSALAEKHRSTIACPITTGIFAWIAAHAAGEAAAAGERAITPYWRTLKAGGELNPKYPGGIAEVLARLQAEGHTVYQKGKRHLVRDFEKALAKFQTD